METKNEKPTKPKENLLVQIAKEAIARTEKKIAAIQATIDDNPLSELTVLDANIEKLVNQYSKCKTHKEIDSLSLKIDELKKQRANCWLRFKKQKDIVKLFDKKHALENEKKEYERAIFHFQFIQF